MAAPSDSTPNSGRRHPTPIPDRGWWLARVALFLAITTYFVLTEGVNVMAVVFTALVGRSVVGALRNSPAWGYDEPLRLRKIAAAVAAVALLFALDAASLGGRPVLAGPALRDPQVATSSTAGRSVAPPGSRLVVIDTVVASWLGAPLSPLDSHDFTLERGERTFEEVGSLSRNIPGTCDDIDVRPWTSQRCTVVFEVPDGVASARLRIETGGASASSAELDLRALPRADLPRVELAARMGVPRPLRYDPERKRIEVLVTAELHGDAPPLPLDGLRLEGSDWVARDRSADAELALPCADAVADGVTRCVAVFDVPHDAATARLIATPSAWPRRDEDVVAGVTDVRF